MSLGRLTNLLLAIGLTVAGICAQPSLALRAERGGSPACLKANSLGPTASGRLFWIASGERGEYRLTRTRLIASTESFRVWTEDSTKIAPNLMASAAVELEKALDSQPLAALRQRAVTLGRDPFPVDVVFALLSAMGGYFSSADQPGWRDSPYSNQANVIYASTAACSLSSGCPASLLAHELQHLLQFLVDPHEETWLNEALSEVAERTVPGAVQPQTLVALECSDFPLLRWPDDGSHAGLHYHAGYSFLSFWQDRFGQTALTAVVTSPRRGVASFRQFLADSGHALSLEEVFLQWAAVQMRLLMSQANGATPLVTGPCQSPSIHNRRRGGFIEDSVSQFGCDYVLLPADAPVSLEFAGTPEVPVIPVMPYQGHFLWWSPGVENGHATLTREFDLRGANEGRLRFWTWYDTEEWYDWGYLAVSTDGGNSWHVLKGEHATAGNPFGTNPGAGYTGRSGEWRPEEVDLSPFAGETIMLRFGYVTDDAVLGPGFCVDEISLEPAGFHDGAEEAGDWVAEGFVRLDQSSPPAQHFGVVAVSTGAHWYKEQTVHVGANATARWTLPPAPGSESRALLICGLTEGALGPASYHLAVDVGHSARGDLTAIEPNGRCAWPPRTGLPSDAASLQPRPGTRPLSPPCAGGGDFECALPGTAHTSAQACNQRQTRSTAQRSNGGIPSDLLLCDLHVP